MTRSWYMREALLRQTLLAKSSISPRVKKAWKEKTVNLNSFNKLFIADYTIWLVEKTDLTLLQIDNIVDKELVEFHNHNDYTTMSPEEAVQLRLFYWHNLGTYPWDNQDG